MESRDLLLLDLCKESADDDFVFTERAYYGRPAALTTVNNNSDWSAFVPPEPQVPNRKAFSPIQVMTNYPYTPTKPLDNGLEFEFSSMSVSPSPPQLSPSKNHPGRYKTEKCRPFVETGTCKYGEKCQFAHGDADMRIPTRHPKFKTEPCRTFHTNGYCPYGPRCHFIHSENMEDLMKLRRGSSTSSTSAITPPESPKLRRQQQSAAAAAALAMTTAMALNPEAARLGLLAAARGLNAFGSAASFKAALMAVAESTMLPPAGYYK